jgi:hypothetical protein
MSLFLFVDEQVYASQLKEISKNAKLVLVKIAPVTLDGCPDPVEVAFRYVQYIAHFFYSRFLLFGGGELIIEQYLNVELSHI